MADAWIAGLHPYDDPVARLPARRLSDHRRRVVAVWHEVMQADAYFPDASELRGSVRITERRADVRDDGRTELGGARPVLRCGPVDLGSLVEAGRGQAAPPSI